jgi:hypothetical protein
MKPSARHIADIADNGVAAGFYKRLFWFGILGIPFLELYHSCQYDNQLFLGFPSSICLSDFFLKLPLGPLINPGRFKLRVNAPIPRPV